MHMGYPDCLLILLYSLCVGQINKIFYGYKNFEFKDTKVDVIYLESPRS